MDIILKNRFLSISVIILIIMNLVLIICLWSIQVNKKEADQMINKNVEDKIIAFFYEELSFNENQKDSLILLFRDYKSKEETMREEIRLLHNSINKNVLNNIPLDRLEKEFDTLGFKKAELDKISYQFFIELREICNNNQKDAFDSTFMDIIKLINDKKKKNK